MSSSSVVLLMYEALWEAVCKCRGMNGTRQIPLLTDGRSISLRSGPLLGLPSLPAPVLAAYRYPKLLEYLPLVRGYGVPPPTALSKLLRSSVLLRLEGGNGGECLAIADTGEDKVLTEGRGTACIDGDF